VVRKAAGEAAAVMIVCATAGAWRAHLEGERRRAAWKAEGNAAVPRSGELRRASRGAKCLHAARMMWTASVITLGVSVLRGCMRWHGGAGAGWLGASANVADAVAVVMAVRGVMRGAQQRELFRDLVELAQGLEDVAPFLAACRECTAGTEELAADKKSST
jgi:hypothetical protein